MIQPIKRYTLEVRQFMPKGTDLGVASQTRINDVAALMHSRPEKPSAGKHPPKKWPTAMKPLHLKFETAKCCSEKVWEG